MRLRLVVAALCVVSTASAWGQVRPSANIREWPVSVGVGFLDYSPDYGEGRRMTGISGWAGYQFYRGLGLQFEAMSIFADKPASIAKLRLTPYQVGAFYRFRTLYRLRPYVLRPYVKIGGGLGNAEFAVRNPLYTHDTYTVYSAGGGAEAKIRQHLWLRGDFEYQFWEHYQYRNTLNPNGFTVGATYYLRGLHGHR